MDIYLDFEMDKVINGEGNIISIGAVKVKNGVIIDTFESLISFSPLGGAVSVETTMLTGIKDSDLIQKPFFPKVFGNFMSWSQDCKRIYCWDSADISSLYYTINQNSYMIKKENLFKGFDSFIQDKFIDLKPYITYINPITQRMSLSNIYQAFCAKRVDIKYLHTPVYDSTLLFNVHHKFIDIAKDENIIFEKGD